VVVDTIDVGFEAVAGGCLRGGLKRKVVGGEGRMFGQNRLNSLRKGMGRAGLGSWTFVRVKDTFVVRVSQLKV
jgi:hypothetical protein